MVAVAGAIISCGGAGTSPGSVVPTASEVIEPSSTTDQKPVNNDEHEIDNELEPGAFVEEPELFEFIADLYGVSYAEARDIARWEQAIGLRVGDPIYLEFGEQLITTEVDSPNRLMIIYVSGTGAVIGARARELMGSDGHVEVRDGFLPADEVSAYWYRIEQALIEAGLSVSGAVRPNEIGVFASDVRMAREIIATIDLPAEVSVIVELGGAPTDLAHG